MAVRTKQEILESIKGIFGENDLSAEQITLLEDIADTVDAREPDKDAVDWKAKYEENDKMWKDKYTQRFFSPDPENKAPGEQETETSGPSTFEELFKEEE